MKHDKDSHASEEAAANIALARAMGSTKGYDPIPPDQYLKWMDKRFSPTIRVWAWRLSKSIRQGHRSPYCVDLNGNAVAQAQCRSDLKIDRGLLSRVWNGLNQEGWGREEGDKLLVCGDVKLPETHAETQSESDTETDEASVDCTVNTSPSILLEINKLDSAVRKATLHRLFRIQAAGKLGRARAVAAWRLAEAEAIDYVLTEVKIKPPERKEKSDDLKQAVVAIRSVFEPLTTQSTAQSAAAANEQSTNGQVYSGCTLPFESTHPYIQSRAEKTSSSSHHNGNGAGPAAAATYVEPKTAAAAAGATAVLDAEIVEPGQQHSRATTCPEDKTAEPLRHWPEPAAPPADSPDVAIAELQARCAQLGVSVSATRASLLRIHNKFSAHLPISKLPKVRTDQKSVMLWLHPDVTPDQMLAEAKRIEISARAPTEKEQAEQAKRARMTSDLERAMRGRRTP